MRISKRRVYSVLIAAGFVTLIILITSLIDRPSRRYAGAIADAGSSFTDLR